MSPASLARMATSASRTRVTGGWLLQALGGTGTCASCDAARSLRRAFGSQGPPPTGGVHDDPGHELATGGLYESARKDRSALPAAWPGTSKEEQGAQGQSTKLPEGAYPVHDDPSATMQHPDQAFGGERAEPGDPNTKTPATSTPPPHGDNELRAENAPSATGAVKAAPQKAGVASKGAQGEGAVQEVARDFAERSSSGGFDASIKNLDGPGKGSGSGM